MLDFTLDVIGRQAIRSVELTDDNRRVLLGASISLLARRFSSGQPILQADVIRAASLADDAVEHAA